jgi:hypothetical protein
MAASCHAGREAAALPRPLCIRVRNSRYPDWTAAECQKRISGGHFIDLMALSGNAEFPHLHLTLRRNEMKVDPLSL